MNFREKRLSWSYFKAVKASLSKLQEKGIPRKSKREIEARINQTLERSIISEEVIDVFDAMGLKWPDVSILSEEFLEEVRQIKHKNLAVEMLKKLLEGNIKTMERTNLVKSERFSEMLKRALNKYRNQAITNAEVIEELIRMANEITKATMEGAEQVGAGIATALVMPHIVLILLAAMFGFLGFFLRKDGFNLTAGILYCVATAAFLLYFMFTIPLIILTFVGYSKQKTMNIEAKSAEV